MVAATRSRSSSCAPPVLDNSRWRGHTWDTVHACLLEGGMAMRVPARVHRRVRIRHVVRLHTLLCHLLCLQQPLSLCSRIGPPLTAPRLASVERVLQDHHDVAQHEVHCRQGGEGQLRASEHTADEIACISLNTASFTSEQCQASALLQQQCHRRGCQAAPTLQSWHRLAPQTIRQETTGSKLPHFRSSNCQ